MRVTVKLFALLSRYLPPGAKDHAVELEVADGATPGGVIDSLNVPRGHCHLVLVNGLYTPPGSVDEVRLSDGDALAIWPPIAGG